MAEMKSTRNLSRWLICFFIKKLQYGIFQAEQHLQAEERAMIKRLRKELGQERDDDEEEEEDDDEEHEEDFHSLQDDPSKLQ